ncbi:MAG TPA: family 16 glycoside hydrolase [Chryseolinea sp.]|nr:family 16 glycoside hydrolase [Chryseolinea sp.]
MKNQVLISLFFVLTGLSFCDGQKKSFNLQQVLKEKKLMTFGRSVVPITDGDKKGISMTGVMWLKDVAFSTGTIDVDLRGKDVLQQSFIGIVFHGVDTSEFDIVYFRPFNFRSQDPVRKIHAVQYATHPDFPWHKLREEHNGIYEKGIDPPPAATEWFHARIIVDDKQIKVYVNNSATPSLTVDKLNTRNSGLIGLSNEGLDGDFANLTISK